MNAIQSKLPIALQGQSSQNITCLKEVRHEMKLIDSKRTLMGRASSIENIALRVVAVVAVLLSYISTGFVLLAIDQKNKASYTEGFLAARKTRAFSLTLGGAVKSLARKAAGVAGTVLGVRLLEKYVPGAYNAVGNYLHGVKEAGNYWGIPAILARGVQTLGFKHATSGLAQFSPKALQLEFMMQAGHGGIMKVLGAAPLDTSLMGSANRGFVSKIFGLGASTIKLAYNEVQRQMPAGRVELLKVEQAINAENTILGKAKAIENVAVRVLALIGVVFLYTLTGFGLAIYDYANRATDKMVETKIKEINIAKRKAELVGLGNQVADAGIFAGLLYAIGGTPAAAIAALCTPAMLPQLALILGLSAGLPALMKKSQEMQLQNLSPEQKAKLAAAQRDQAKKVEQKIYQAVKQLA